jgi:hypothetical protein
VVRNLERAQDRFSDVSSRYRLGCFPPQGLPGGDGAMCRGPSPTFTHCKPHQRERSTSATAASLGIYVPLAARGKTRYSDRRYCTLKVVSHDCSVTQNVTCERWERRPRDPRSVYTDSRESLAMTRDWTLPGAPSRSPSRLGPQSGRPDSNRGPHRPESWVANRRPR